jgi:hypothetical protein
LKADEERQAKMEKAKEIAEFARNLEYCLERIKRN